MAEWTEDSIVDLYGKLEFLSKILEGSGRIDQMDTPEAYPTILEAMGLVMDLRREFRDG